jgi:hypothetical protein
VDVTQLGIRELCSQPSYLRGDIFGTETQVWWPTLSRHPFSVPKPLFFRFASALRALNDFFFRFLFAVGDFDGPVSAPPPRVSPVRPSRSPPVAPSKTVLPPMLPALSWVLLVALVAAHRPHVSPVRPCLVSAGGSVWDGRASDVTAASDAGLGSSCMLSLLFEPSRSRHSSVLAARVLARAGCRCCLRNCQHHCITSNG